MTECRIGLVGAGGVAQRHAQVLSGFPEVRLAGVTDVQPEAAAALADPYGAPVFPDLDQLIASGLDAVYVCIPPFAHGTAEETVIRAGLPMFVEKPLSADLATAERLAGLIAERGLLTAVGHHWRYADQVTAARAALDGRAIRLVTGSWLDKVPPPAWWVRRDGSGGPVVEQAAHVLDLARLLAGEVDEVTAFGNGTPPAVDGADVDSATAAVLRFAGGAVGTLGTTSSLTWKHRAGLEIFADGLALSLTEDELVIRDADGERRSTADPHAARIAVDRAFVDAVLGRGDDIRVPYAEALRTHRLACALAESAASRAMTRV